MSSDASNEGRRCESMSVRSEIIGVWISNLAERFDAEKILLLTNFETFNFNFSTLHSTPTDKGHPEIRSLKRLSSRLLGHSYHTCLGTTSK